MNRLLLIALLFVFVWYLWWRVRRRFAMLSARFNRPRTAARTARTAAPRDRPLTLEKDPVTGVYREPKG
jgi:hypothetical protein